MAYEMETTQMFHISERINKLWYTNTNGILLCNKKGANLIHTATWINIKNITLSEKIQHQRLYAACLFLDDIFKK